MKNNMNTNTVSVESEYLVGKWEGLIDDSCIQLLKNSKFLQRCNQGTITHEELHGFLVQQYYYAKHFVRYVCSLMANLNSLDDVKLLLENLCEEMGVTAIHTKPHSKIYLEMLNHFNININAYDELSSTRELVKTMLNHCNNKDETIGLAALCLGAEAIVPYLYKNILNGFINKSYNINYLQFFVLHIECDDDHALIMKNLILKNRENHPEKRELIVAVGKEMIALRVKFLDAISDYYLKEAAA